MGRRMYGKAIGTGWILTLLGCIAGVVAIILADATKQSGYFAMLVFGVLFVIAGLTTVFVYAGMERAARRVLGEGRPLLKFMIAARDYAAFAEAEAEEIRSANKASLMIAAVFCGLVAVVGPFAVKHDGYIMFFIGVGLALFLTVAAWLITAYRIHKLHHAPREVILTEECALVGNQLHQWSTPATFLSEVDYYPAGTYNGCENSVMRITYSALTATVITPYSFLIPVPHGLEQQAVSATAALRQRLGTQG